VLRLLPSEVLWHARNCVEKPEKWEYEGDSHDEIGYFYKEFPANSDEYNRVLELFKILRGDELPIKRIIAVYNPSLTSRFANNTLLLQERSKAVPWSNSWKDDDFNGLREKVFQEYTQKVNSFSWNNELKVPILAAIHGTGLATAKAISKTGFAALSSLDAGYFGKGIYFSSDSLYSLPYAVRPGVSEPTLILSFVVPGNIYPTVEQHKGPQSLMGKPLRTPGYHSHFVLTNKDGLAISPENILQNVYDEIVIPVEAQVVPAYIIELENSSELQKLYNSFAREIQQKCE